MAQLLLNSRCSCRVVSSILYSFGAFAENKQVAHLTNSKIRTTAAISEPIWLPRFGRIETFRRRISPLR